MSTESALAGVVGMNECAKAVLRYAFEVKLSALGAIVRSSRAGRKLAGFGEVARQMRRWCVELEAVVAEVTTLTAARVGVEALWLQRQRQVQLLSAAAAHPAAARALEPSLFVGRRALSELAREREQSTCRLLDAFDQVGQLGLMASVLSRASLIEAASGDVSQRRELALASHEFASYAERVCDAVVAVRKLTEIART